MIQALVFDFDGVIIQSEDATFQLLQKIIREHGYTLDRSMFAAKVEKEITPFLDEVYNTKLPQEVQSSVTRAFYHEYSNNPLKYITPVAPVLSFLSSYTGTVPLAIASMSARADIDQILAHFNIQNTFSCIVSSDDVPKLKPDPAVYIKVAQKLGISPSYGAVIEDSIPGAQASIGAGFQTYILLTGVNHRLDFYDFNVKGFILSKQDIVDIFTT